MILVSFKIILFDDNLFYIMMIDYFYIIKLCFDLQNQFNI
jgi:hypothetical protein